MELRPTLKFIKTGYVVALVLAVAIGVYRLVDSRLGDYALLLFVVPALILISTVNRHIRRGLVKLTILDDRLRYESGMFSKSTRTIELAKIQDVRVDQTVWQRMFNIGDLSLETAGGSSRIEMDRIDQPQQAADHILGLARGSRPGPEAGKAGSV